MYYTDHMRSVKVLATALMLALGIIALATAFLFYMPGTSLLAKPNPVIFLAQVAAGVAVHLFNEHVTYKPKPLPAISSRNQVKNRAVGAYQSGMILRFALSEAIAIVSLSVAFLVGTGGWLTYLCGALVSAALMGYHVYPWARPIDKTQAALDAEGGQSHLREIFGLDPWTGTDADKPYTAPATR